MGISSPCLKKHAQNGKQVKEEDKPDVYHETKPVEVPAPAGGIIYVVCVAHFKAAT